jgi:DNA polymerase delta subunit 3
MYMDNLEEWILEENKVVTYKYLSRSLKVHVNVAKQMLFNFVETKKSSKTPLLGIVYLVSGAVENKNVEGSADDATESTTQKVMLVKEKDLTEVLPKLSVVYSQHIYSVQLAEAVSQTSLYATDLEVFREDPAGATALAAIKNKNAVPREAVRIPIEVKKAVVKKEVKVEVKKEVKKTGIEGAFARTKKQSPKKTDSNGDVKEEKPKVVEKASSKASKKPAAANNIANFFAKQAAKPKVEKTEQKQEKVEVKNEEKENIVNQRIEDESVRSAKNNLSASKEVLKSPVKENRKSPSKSKTAKKTPPNKKSKKESSRDDDSKKRKRIQVMSDSEDEAGEDEDEKVEAVVEDAPPTAKLIESSDDEEIPPTPKQPTRTSKPGRRRVKRQVDKTYVDDQGFMVTKKEYESASETDEEPEPVKEKEKTPKKVEAPVAKKAKLAAPGAKSQAGIMSFFKKK